MVAAAGRSRGRGARARVRRVAVESVARARAGAAARPGPRRTRGRGARPMEVKIPVAFLAGFVSVVTPCVLPLVPGYLSALSSVQPGKLAERRVVRASLPFIAGFTVVFVVLGAGAAAIGGIVSASAQAEIAGFVLVVLGLAFLGALPMPERVMAPGLLTGARRRGSGLLLGGAFAVCAAPCIGTVLAAVLVLASDTGA